MAAIKIDILDGILKFTPSNSNNVRDPSQMLRNLTNDDSNDTLIIINRLKKTFLHDVEKKELNLLFFLTFV